MALLSCGGYSTGGILIARVIHSGASAPCKASLLRVFDNRAA